MPTYGKENFKESNINYLNKDFTALKESLMDYAKSYFPNTYRDFNETSPGMMLLEMNAYVGDVLSFYVDQQYREMLLPLAEERRNIITMAKMFGYKVKPIVPSYVDLTFTSEVNASSGDVSKVDYSNAGTFDAGIEIASDTDANIIFTTLEPIDFRITGSNDGDTIGTTAASGLASTYTLSRTVKAVSATEKTISFQVGVPEKFKTLTIPDTNVIDIISCVDSNGNNWYEVDFLAQDKVVIQTHYTDDINRDSAYVDATGLSSTSAVPYSLSYIATTKRFTRETNQNNTTSLVFGNGVLKDGQVVDDSFIDTEQIGIIIPGQTNDLNNAIDPLLGDEYSTLGETPNNTTLTITYRVGGGVSSNVPSGDISTTPSLTAQNGNTSATLTSVTNNRPARGGKDEEDTTEIKERAKAFFSTQNRCVTKEDYEARVLNVPSKFGNIAKAYVARNIEGDTAIVGQSELDEAASFLQSELQSMISEMNNIQNEIVNASQVAAAVDVLLAIRVGDLVTTTQNLLSNQVPIIQQTDISTFELSSINIYLLGYNNLKQLVGNPHSSTLGTTDNLPTTLMSNIKNYLENFKLMTDTITINDGYIVNFGVIFDVIAEKYADKQQVKLKCIQKIKDYFRIEKMQFNQPIYKSQLEFELMGVEGVRSIGHVTITQKDDYNTDVADADLLDSTYSYSYANNGTFEDSTINGGGTAGYGFKYDFQTALSDDKSIILPPLTSTPTVFELKNPNTNIQGRVR
tara:strand:- start:3733 stop:5964 length:2232 start_codon:yes stop_codon:yes gene_type:complete